MGLDVPILAVVGRSGSGKTTLLEELVPALRALGLRIGVVKHHGHSSPFDVPGKDTYRLSEAGADVVVGVSAVQIAEFKPREDRPWEEQAGAAFADVDLVLAEGFSQSDYPKVEVHRSSRSGELLSDVDELVAIVSDIEWAVPVPVFDRNEVEALARMVEQWHAKSSRQNPRSLLAGD